MTRHIMLFCSGGLIGLGAAVLSDVRGLALVFGVLSLVTGIHLLVFTERWFGTDKARREANRRRALGQ